MKFTDSKFVGSYPGYESTPRHNLPEIAIGGKSNVGKSSLINSLLKRKKLAQTSKTPGKTRLLNYFVIEGKPGKSLMYFVDLPGYGYAKVSAETRKSWQPLVEGFLEKSTNLRGFLLLIDSRRGIGEDEDKLLEYLSYKIINTCPVLTKSDKLNRQDKSKIVRETSAKVKEYGDMIHFPILHSSVSGEGNDLIWRWMDERIKDES